MPKIKTSIKYLFFLLLVFSCGESYDCSEIRVTENKAYLKNELFTGECIVKDKDILIERQTYLNGIKSGKWEQFYYNGKKKYIGYCENNELHGPYNEYHITGELSVSGAFEKGYKSGVWKYYDETGVLIEQKNYVPEPNYVNDNFIK